MSISTKKVRADLPSSEEMMRLALNAALDKKALDVMSLKVGELVWVTDYFVIATGSTDRQVHAIADEIEKRMLDELHLKPTGREGRDEATWILLDYDDIVVHIFQPATREEYRLEKLWAQAEKLLVREDGTSTTTAATLSDPASVSAEISE